MDSKDLKLGDVPEGGFFKIIEIYDKPRPYVIKMSNFGNLEVDKAFKDFSQ